MVMGTIKNKERCAEKEAESYPQDHFWKSGLLLNTGD